MNSKENCRKGAVLVAVNDELMHGLYVLIVASVVGIVKWLRAELARRQAVSERKTTRHSPFTHFTRTRTKFPRIFSELNKFTGDIRTVRDTFVQRYGRQNDVRK